MDEVTPHAAPGHALSAGELADSVPAAASGMTVEEILGLPVSTDIATTARALGIGRTTAHELARKGNFPCQLIKVGGQYRVPRAELLRMLCIEDRA
jgi:hypothetical protein